MVQGLTYLQLSNLYFCLLLYNLSLQLQFQQAWSKLWLDNLHRKALCLSQQLTYCRLTLDQQQFLCHFFVHSFLFTTCL